MPYRSQRSNRTPSDYSGRCLSEELHGTCGFADQESFMGCELYHRLAVHDRTMGRISLSLSFFVSLIECTCRCVWKTTVSSVSTSPFRMNCSSTEVWYCLTKPSVRALASRKLSSSLEAVIFISQYSFDFFGIVNRLFLSVYFISHVEVQCSSMIRWRIQSLPIDGFFVLFPFWQVIYGEGFPSIRLFLFTWWFFSYSVCLFYR